MSFEPEELSVEEVQAYRERTGAGIMEAKRFLQKQKLLAALTRVRDHGTVEDKLDFILAYIEDKEAPRHPMTGALLTFP